MAKKKDAGELKRARISDLFSPQLKKTTIVATILFALAYGAAFGSLQQMRLIIPDTPQVVTAAATAAEKAEAKAKEEANLKSDQDCWHKSLQRCRARGRRQGDQSSGSRGLFGRAIMALLIIAIIARGATSVWAFVGWSQLAFFLVLEGMNGFHGTMNEHFVRAGKGLIYGGLLGLPVWFICTSVIKAFRDAPSGTVLRLFQLPGMIIPPLTFAYLITNSLSTAYIGMFLCGFLVVGQFTFWEHAAQIIPDSFAWHR